MSRSGYSEDCDDNWAIIRWRGAVASASKGKRGQQFFADLHDALLALPEKKLIAESLEENNHVCALGCLGKARGIDMSSIDPDDIEKVAKIFAISKALAAETVWMNDEAGCALESPESRYLRILKWVEGDHP